MDCLIKNARILITGGAGFIGSHLAETLLRQNNRVLVLDNFSTGRRENLAAFQAHPAFTLMEGDIRDRETCRRAARGADYIFHQAALGSVPRSIADPATSVEVNVSGFVNMLAAAAEVKPRRFVYASSSSVYGDSAALPKQEDQTGNLLSPYAATKHCCEIFADVFARTYGLECIGLRYFNVFGPRQNPAGPYAAVIPKFLTALRNHESPVIHGDGSFSRDFTYVDNVVLANQLAALAGADAMNRVYNIAAGCRTTLNELFALLRDALAMADPAITEIAPVYDAVRAGDIPHSLASIEKAEHFLKYKPVVSTAEGIRRTVKHIAL